MENTFWSLIPPLLAIVMVLLTRRVLVSLGVGIVASALFIASFQLGDTVVLVWESFKNVFVADGAPNTGNIFILLFVLMLGILTALVNMMGGTRAFGDYMIKRVKTRAGAQIMTMILGIIIFVDDYFNSLTVGQVAMPVTDKQRISRAKLAYTVDSTSAPICVIAPISSWGAYIIGILGTVLATHSVTTHSAFGAFIEMIPMNFYVWATLGVVLIIALRQVDFGPMKKHEQRAIQTGEVLNPDSKMNDDPEENLPISNGGKLADLIVPIVVLFVSALGFIYWSGFQALDADRTVMNVFGEADVPFALLCGGITGIIASVIMFSRHLSQKMLNGKQFVFGILEGAKSMLPGFFILIFAWAIVFLIGELETGIYLGDLVQKANVSFIFLPMIVFIMAGLIAFATGTSWGSFGILLPIAGQIAAATDIDLLLPMLAAVLAGAVFGDHCSPISDTTILSSAGSKCPHIDHVTTQLPYALVAAGISVVGYLILGLTGNVWLGLVSIVLLLIVLFYSLRKPAE